MKKFGIKALYGAIGAFAMALIVAAQVSAVAPNLSVITTNSTMQVTVYGDANSPVLLNYYSNGLLLGAGSIGYTNYSGYFSTTLNSYNYPLIPNGAQVVVSVNGQQSLPAIWQGNGSGNQYPNYGGAPVLSQANLSMTVGQSQVVSISNNNGYGQYYVANNANNVVSATVNGNTLNLYAMSVGSTTLSVCSNYGGGYNNCATLYVTVSGSYYPQYPQYPNYPQYPTYPTYPPYNGVITLNPQSVQVTVGSTGVVSVGDSYQQNSYFSQGVFYVVNNNNGAVASAFVAGNIVNIYGKAPGSTTFTVCSYVGNQCASVYVTVLPSYSSPYYPSYPYNNGGWYWPQ